VQRMRRSYNRMMADVDTKGLPMARRITRWSQGGFDIYCASLSWQNGNVLGATGLAALGIARDPQWLLRHSVRGRVRGHLVKYIKRLLFVSGSASTALTPALSDTPLGRPFSFLNPDVEASISDGNSVAARRGILIEIGKRPRKG